jgi:Bacterial Ig-like domain (group 3)/FG-GAP-like repeat/FG-GAP repeat
VLAASLKRQSVASLRDFGRNTEFPLGRAVMSFVERKCSIESNQSFTQREAGRFRHIERNSAQLIFATVMPTKSARPGELRMSNCSDAKRSARSPRPWIARFATAVLLYSIAVAAVHAAGTTTTTLAVAPGNTVQAGTPVTLTALVTNPAPVSAGLVAFCDAAAAHCSGPAILGTAQLVVTGTAAIKITLGVGTHQIKAVFGATNANLSSTSSTQTIIVTGNASYATSMALTATGNPGNYTLSTQLVAFGRVAPTGTVSFLDISNGNAVVATVPTEAAAPPQTMQLLGAPFVPSNVPYGAFLPAPGQISIGPQTVGVTVGDFNGDGIQDLVTASVGDGLLGVLLGNGNGTFQPRATYAAPAGSDPSSVVVGDFNGDGRQDLAVVNGFGGTETLSIFLGNGDGTFQPQVPYNAGRDPVGLASGDLNGDGFADLIAVDLANGTVNVLLGNGDGTFQPQVTYPVGNTPYSAVAGDFDQDGNLDVAVTNSDDNTVSVLLGKGDGTLKPQVIYVVGTAPRTLALGDFNGDGFLDLAVTNFNDSTVTILLGKSDKSGTFQMQPPAVPTGLNPAGIAVGDFNGDGLADLAVTNFGANTVSILLGKGDGTFQLQVAYTGNIGASPYPVAVGDFNGDGIPDLAIANNGDLTASVLLGVQAETHVVNNVTVTGPGTHNVLASYPGDTAHAPSQSTTVPLIGLLATTTVLTSSAQTVPSGQPLTFTATVSSTSGVPTGSVNFYDATTLLGTATLNAGGVATFTDTLSAGSHTITATYTGDTNFNRSTSAPVTVTITLATVTDFVVGSAIQSQMVNPGGKVSFAIVVVSVDGSYNSPVALTATGLPAGATATFSPPSLTPGDNSATSILAIRMPSKVSFIAPGPQPPSPLWPLQLATLATALTLLGLNQRVKPLLQLRPVAVGAIGFLLLAVVIAGVSGCRGGFIASSPRSFAITVTGTSGSQQHSTTVILNVR